jgi:hypothetical protein
MIGVLFRAYVISCLLGMVIKFHPSCLCAIRMAFGQSGHEFSGKARKKGMDTHAPAQIECYVIR